MKRGNLVCICTTCGGDTFKIVAAADAPSLRVALPTATPAPAAVAAIGAKTAVCGCGHERAWHVDGSGPCAYGRGTGFGGCRCDGYHRKKRHPSSPAPGQASDAGALGDYARQLLGAFRPIGESLTRDEIAIRAVVSPSGTFNKAIAQLARDGYLQKSGTRYVRTDAGVLAAAKLPERPLLEQWCERLAEYPSLLLGAVAGVYPEALTRAEIATRAGVATSGTFNKQIAKLVRMRLVVRIGSQYGATHALGIKHGAAA